MQKRLTHSVGRTQAKKEKKERKKKEKRRLIKRKKEIERQK